MLSACAQHPLSPRVARHGGARHGGTRLQQELLEDGSSHGSRPCSLSRTVRGGRVASDGRAAGADGRTAPVCRGVPAWHPLPDCLPELKGSLPPGSKAGPWWQG